MQSILFMLICVINVFSTLVAAEDRQLIQQQLDKACEADRLVLLAPEREQHIQACISDGNKTVADCREFYQDYGDAIYNNTGDIRRFALYYDLPACEKAWQHRNSYRQPD